MDEPVFAPLGRWLQAHGLQHHAEAFEREQLTLDDLPDLDEQDLRELGLATLGERKRFLRAVAGRQAPGQAPASAAPPAVDAGTATARATRQAAAQRRQVTVLFCDLVGSTALSTQMDPEDYGDLIARYHAEASRLVHDAGGFVAQLLGDGVLAYFGYPMAGEDDAERAVRTGLALARERAAAAAARPPAPGLAVRVGIATGTVVIGERVAQGQAAEHAAVGDTPNLAARLQSLAQPGQVLVAESTRRLVGEQFEMGDRGVHVLKGFAQPVPVWQALGEREGSSRFDARRGGATGPLVGRDGELAMLVERWERVLRGAGQLVLISGEPGIGKSRITAALRHRLQDALQADRPEELVWQCSPLHRGTPLHPVVAQLRQAALRGQGPAHDGLEQQLLRAGVGPEARTRILHLAGVRRTGGAAGGDASVERLNTLHALVDALASRARHRPLLLLVEDAHWIDPSTAELLALCVQQLRGQRVMLVVTTRPGRALGCEDVPHLTQLALGRMSQQQCVELAQRVALDAVRGGPGRATLTPRLLEQIVLRTDGIPLFVEELTRSVLEAAPTQGGGEAGLPVIPSTLQDSLMARLDRLQPATRELAQAAAVIGREFEEPLLHQVMRPMPAAQVEAALEELQATGLVLRSLSPHRPLASFKHALVRDAAYGTLLKGPRAARHAAVARAMAVMHPQLAAQQPELLAGHHQLAGEHAQALQRWREAGDLAFSRSSLPEAADHYRGAIALCPAVQPGEALEFHLQMQLSAVLTQTQGYASEEGLRAARRALALSQAPDLAEHRVEAVRAVATILVSRGRIDETRQLLGDAVTLQQAGASPRAEASWLWVHGAADVVAGRFGAARQHLCAALERMDTMGDGHAALQWHGANPRVSTLSWLERALMFLGLLEQGLACAEQSLVLARQSQHPPTLTWVLLNLVSWYHLAGRRQEAAALAREASELAQRHQIRSRIGVARVMQGRALVLGGRVAEGAAMMRSGIDLWLETCSVLTATLLVTGPAWAMASVGDAQAVREYLGIGERLMQETQERAGEVELMRLRAWLHRHDGDAEAARSTLQDALGVAERQESSFFALRVSLDLVALARGDRHEASARDGLRRVFDSFSEGFAFAPLQEARRVLDAPPQA